MIAINALVAIAILFGMLSSFLFGRAFGIAEVLRDFKKLTKRDNK